MALQTSGPISLNDIHIEAGGGSGTNCTINDTDIRGLISKGSGVTMSFNEWYGASSVQEYTITTEGSYYSTYGYDRRPGNSVQIGAIDSTSFVDSDGDTRTIYGLINTTSSELNFYLSDYTKSTGWTKLIILDDDGTTTYEVLRSSATYTSSQSQDNSFNWRWSSGNYPSGINGQLDGSGTTTFQII